MKHKKIVQAAIKEAINLKKHLTPREKERLEWQLFRPDHDDYCIYGLATGNCHSKRAVQLIRKCTVNGGIPNWQLGKAKDIDLTKKVKIGRRDKYDNINRDFTPLESIIDTKGFKRYNKNLLDFIAGRVDIINLKEALKN